MTDLSATLALAADVLDDLAPRLRNAAEALDSDAEAGALQDALRGSIRLARQYRNLTLFLRTAGAPEESGAGRRPVSRGSGPRAQLRALDPTEAADGFRPE